jgi:hypothetical protein
MANCCRRFRVMASDTYIMMRQAYFSIKGILAMVVHSATKIKHLKFSKSETGSDVSIQHF